MCMCKWLVVFSNMEFILIAENIHTLKKEVERQIPLRGLRKGQPFEVYRIGEAVAYGTV